MRFRFLLFLLIFLFPLNIVADEIHIIYESAKIDGQFGYWYGKGTLNAEIKDDFWLNIGDARIISFSGAIPIKREGDKIYFMKQDERFECAFLLPRPKGQGLYKLSFNLPQINNNTDVEIEIVAGEKLLSSNPHFKSQKEGNYLILKGKTNKAKLSFIYITKLSYMLLSDALAGSIFILILIGYVAIRRKEIKEKFNMNLSEIKRKIMSQIVLKQEEGCYEISLEKPFGHKENRFFFRIPFWFISAIIIIFLLIVFFFSLTNPLKKIWDSLGIFKLVIMFFALFSAILSGLLLISAKDYKELSLRFGIIGGGIIGSMFGYLGIFAIILAIVTCLLIYFLSILLIEEEG
ncbi:membrane protein [Candidatus Desulfofervidus auxilii]|uniref:Membrane protein n=1 Tax=Desulfofervidus auxilii TaxID=1621989 RepID=A0A7U4TGF7_DESA2|nr:hypothetical protein [Candidatus Desulfofervidus auxilii]AMM40589.1 membrane protein [Candidatus Desulfofervidus auxilii]